MTLDIAFTPILSIYIYADSAFQVGRIISGDVENLLWRHDLDDGNLPNPVQLILTWNVVQNVYELVLV